MRALWLVFVLSSCVCAAQDNWADAGMPYYSVGFRQVYSDPGTDSLLALGLVTEGNDFSGFNLLAYKRGTWSIIEQGRGELRSAVRYGDTLVIAGGLWEVDGIPVSRIAARYNGTWHSFGTFGDTLGNWGIRKLRVLNGTLYAVGGFEYVDGHLCNGIAKRENGHWVNIGLLESDSSSDPILTDVIEFQGEIYACGLVSIAPGGENGIVKYDGTSWTAPGGGIRGGNAGGLCMAIYNNELVLGGTIHRSAGNAGHMIMRWNGTEWHGLGSHLRDQNNDTIGEARCYALLPYQDKLLVAGGFWYAGGVPAGRFATWDGENWCGNNDEWELFGESLTVFDDTLFMASGYELNGMPINRIAKWVGGPVEGSPCTSVGIEEDDQAALPMIYPNPSSGSFVVSVARYPNAAYRVFDPFGRIVTYGRLDAFGIAQVNMGHTASGVYSISIDTVTAGHFNLRIVHE